MGPRRGQGRSRSCRRRSGATSLLEGMVFAGRVVEAVAAGRDGPATTGAMRALDGATSLVVSEQPSSTPTAAGDAAATRRAALQAAMSAGAGVLRDAASLARADALAVEALVPPPDGTVERHELANLAQVARGVVAAAAAR